MIDGGGAELIFHGGILPIVVDGSSDVTVKNLTIDYAAPFFSQAEIISSDRYTTVLRFDGEEFGCTVAPDGRFRFVTHDPVTGETGHSDAESPLSLEFDSNLRDGTRNATLIEATTIRLEDVCAGVVSGEHVTIGPNCRIDRLDCTGDFTIDPSSTVRLLNGEPYMPPAP